MKDKDKDKDKDKEIDKQGDIASVVIPEGDTSTSVAPTSDSTLITSTGQQDDTPTPYLHKDIISPLLYGNLKLCIGQYGLDEGFGIKMFSYLTKTDGYGFKVVNLILKEWGCIEEVGGRGRLDLNKLPDPSLVRPCARLMDLYTRNGMGEPHEMFKVIDDSPSSFNKMVYIYRMAYDIIWAGKLAYVDEGQALNFVANTSLFQLEEALSHDLGV